MLLKDDNDRNKWERAFFFSIFFWRDGILGELGASNLLRRALYYLSLATSTFCVGYF
jgi:hypothetical protein